MIMKNNKWQVCICGAIKYNNEYLKKTNYKQYYKTIILNKKENIL